MLLLGLDLGTSSTKVSVLDAATRECRCAVSYPPGEEREITARQPGWAEQSPVQWWAVWPLALGVFAGGLLGPAVVRRLPAGPLRVGIALAGLALAVSLSVEAW